MVVLRLIIDVFNATDRQPAGKPSLRKAWAKGPSLGLHPIQACPMRLVPSPGMEVWRKLTRKMTRGTTSTLVHEHFD